MADVTETTKIEIRKLTVADRKRLSNMLEKFVSVAGDSSLLNVISSAAGTAVKKDSGAKAESEPVDMAIKIGVRVIQSLLTTLEEETHEWFADLIGVTKEEFLQLPVDTEPKIVEQLVSAQEASSFFTIASRLYSKIESLQDKFFGAKKQSDTVTD